jgi:hypothetical protein
MAPQFNNLCSLSKSLFFLNFKVVFFTLPKTLHMMEPQPESSNPMAISRFLNQLDDEDDRPTSGRHSQTHHEDRGFSDSRLLLPLRPVNPRREVYDRQSERSYRNFYGRQRRRLQSALLSSSLSRQSLDRGSRTPHSNKAYTIEQQRFIRYTKEDLGIPWRCHPARFRQFWGDNRDSDQCFSSRYYRSNIRPRHENWVPILVNRRPVMDPAPVRGRSTPEGRAMDFPYTLIELCPHRALEYSWVSLVDKARAIDILRQDELRETMLENGTFVDPDPKNSKSLA